MASAHRQRGSSWTIGIVRFAPAAHSAIQGERREHLIGERPQPLLLIGVGDGVRAERLAAEDDIG